MAGTTNLLQWNPTATNQETDAQYAADSQRTGGATNPSVFEAELANKAYFQWSTYLTALFKAFANKGFTTSDSNLNTLTAQCANFLTTADLKPTQVQVPFSSTPVFDGSVASGFRIDLAGNVTSSSLVNVPPPGALVTFFIVSASPGNYSFAWPPNVTAPRDVKTESQGNLLTEQFISDGATLFPLSNFLNTLKSQVNAAQGTANTALANAATAQSTANGAQSAASAAQGTANTAVSSAAAAQGSANTALAQIAALAVGGSRVDVTGARSFFTTYTNTGSALVVVTGYATTVGSNVGSVSAIVAGSPDYGMTTGATVDGGAIGFCFFVPPGATYRVEINTLTGGRSGVTGLGKWIETTVTL